MTGGTWSVSFSPHPAAGGHVYGAHDCADAFALVERVVAELFALSPERRAVTVEIARPCGTCRGTGHRPKQRKKLYPDPCKATGCDAGYVTAYAESRLRCTDGAYGRG